MNGRTSPYLIVNLIIGLFLIPMSFTLCNKDNKATFVVPVLTTNATSSITDSTATSGGNIFSDGGDPVTIRGVCWSASKIPDITDNRTNDGSGTGKFISRLTDLKQGTPYFVRAYATNSTGTAYGAVQTFTTNYESVEPGFFPIAVWLQDPLNASAYKENGINVYAGLWNELDQDQLDLLKNAGMKIICTQNNFGLSILSEPD